MIRDFGDFDHFSLRLIHLRAECEPATIDEMAVAELQDLKAFFKMPKEDRLRNINVLPPRNRPGNYNDK
jgi:hypothetical protein